MHDRSGSLTALVRMAALLALAACSSSGGNSSTDGPPAQADALVSADAPVDAQPDTTTAACGSGHTFADFPCCYFWQPEPTDAAPPGSCRADQCIPGSTADGGAPLAVICPAGYASAVVCPSPLGGCGGAPTCCKVGP